MSLVKEAKTKIEDTQSRVMALLDWTQLQYAEFQEAQGYAYLESWIPGDAHAIKQLSYSADFWAWWRNHWFKRDESFLNLNFSLTDKPRRGSLHFSRYEKIHQVEGMEYTPHTPVLTPLNKPFVPFVDAKTAKLREIQAAVKELERLELEYQQLERVSK